MNTAHNLRVVHDLDDPQQPDDTLTALQRGADPADPTEHDTDVADWRAETIATQWEPESQLVGALMWLPAACVRRILELVPDTAIWRPMNRWAYELIRSLVDDARDPDPVTVLARGKTQPAADALQPDQPPTPERHKRLALLPGRSLHQHRDSGRRGKLRPRCPRRGLPARLPRTRNPHAAARRNRHRQRRSHRTIHANPRRAGRTVALLRSRRQTRMGHTLICRGQTATAPRRARHRDRRPRRRRRRRQQDPDPRPISLGCTRLDRNPARPLCSPGWQASEVVR